MPRASAPTSRASARCTSTIQPFRGRRLHQFRPGRRHRPDLRAAAGQRRPARTDRPAVDARSASPTSSSIRSTARTLLISSSTGNIFETTNQGETWFDIGTPATFGSPGQPQPRPGLRRPRPHRPRGRRQPRQLHLRRDLDRQGLRHPERRRQLDQHLHRAGWLAPSSRSSPIPPGAATTPTPSPPTASTTWPTRSPRPATATPTLGQHHRQHQDPGLFDLRPELRPDHRPQHHAVRPGHGLQLDRGQLELRDPQQSRRPQPGIPPGPVRRRQLGRLHVRPTTARPGPSTPPRPTAPWPTAATCPTSTSPT